MRVFHSLHIFLACKYFCAIWSAIRTAIDSLLRLPLCTQLICLFVNYKRTERFVLALLMFALQFAVYYVRFFMTSCWAVTSGEVWTLGNRFIGQHLMLGGMPWEMFYCCDDSDDLCHHNKSRNLPSPHIPTHAISVHRFPTISHFKLWNGRQPLQANWIWRQRELVSSLVNQNAFYSAFYVNILSVTLDSGLCAFDKRFGQWKRCDTNSKFHSVRLFDVSLCTVCALVHWTVLWILR